MGRAVGIAVLFLVFAPVARAQDDDAAHADDAIFVAPPAPTPRGPTRVPSALVHFTATGDRPLTIHQWIEERWFVLCTTPCTVDLALGSHVLALSVGEGEPTSVGPLTIDGPLDAAARHDDRDFDRVVGAILIGAGVAIGAGIGGGLLGYASGQNRTPFDEVDAAELLWAEIGAYFAMAVGLGLTIGGLVLAGHRRDVWIRDATTIHF